MKLDDEIEQARRGWQLAMLIGDPQPELDYLNDLEAMEGATRFMPHTRLSISVGALANLDTIEAEIEAYLSRLPNPAAPRRRFLAFHHNPTVHTLRRIWMR